MKKFKIEILFAEFGKSRGNHGGVDFKGDRLNPSLSTFSKYFPTASIRVITDCPEDFEQFNSSVSIEVIEKDEKFLDRKNYQDVKDPLFSKLRGRRGSCYYRFIGMLNSKADIVIYTDTDMFVYSEKVLEIIDMVNTFGVCIPANPRLLFEKDMLLGIDGPVKGSDDYKLGMRFRNMHSFNSAPIFFSTKHDKAREFITECAKTIIEHEIPMRSPSAINLASIKTGFFPCVLPFQWCVSRDNIDDEIILHVGKDQIAKKYFSGG